MKRLSKKQKQQRADLGIDCCKRSSNGLGCVIQPYSTERHILAGRL
jgi:hypothetical protein